MERLEDRRLLAVVWDRVEPLGSLIFKSDVSGESGAPATSSLSEITTAFVEGDQTLTIVAAPDNASATLTATVRDSGSAVLATATAAGPGETLALQTINLVADGYYDIEISGDVTSEYQLTLYRNATVEVVDTDDGAELDASDSFISLGTGRFGIVGRFDGAGGGGDPLPVVWAIQPGSGDILKINPADGSIFGSFDAPDALASNHAVNGLSIAEGGDSLLYVNGGVNGNNLYRLDPVDGTVLSIESLGGFGGNRGGLSFESAGPDAIFAIDNGGPVDRQLGFGGPLTDWTSGGVNGPGALGGDDNGRLFVFRQNQIREYSTTSANTLLNSMPLPVGAQGATGLAYDGTSLYLSDFVGKLFTLDPDTGQTLNQVVVGGGFLSGLGAAVIDSSTLLPNAGADVDEYLLDLTGRAGDSVDIVISLNPAAGSGSLAMELLGTDAATVLGVGQDASDNFDLGILSFVVPADGVYTIRVSSDLMADYAVVVTDSLVFDTESNAPTDSPLRSIDAYEGALGYLSSDVDTYEVNLAAGQQIGLSTSTPFDDLPGGLNLLNPSIEVLTPGGQSAAFDSNGAADGKNAFLPSFTAGAAGVYNIVVAAEDAGDGEYVLEIDFNSGPTVGALTVSAGTIFENQSVSLTGSYSDQDLGDSHSLEVNWDDPNSGNSNFAIPPINALSVGDSFVSSTDAAIVEITTLDQQTGDVGFSVSDHRYLDDGPAPGNGTFEDESVVVVSVTDSAGSVAFPETQNVIANGGFETGDFTGWTIANFGDGAWSINNGTLDPAGPALPLTPISGGHDAVTAQTGPGFSSLSQLFTIPSSVHSAVLSWSDRIRNFSSSGFVDSIDEFRVWIGSHEVFSTDPGDPTQQVGPNYRSFDLTTLFRGMTGDTVQLSFQHRYDFEPFNVSLDDVRLDISTGANVLVKNTSPRMSLDTVTSIDENEFVTLTGAIVEVSPLDGHHVVIDWNDPKNPVNSTYAFPAAATLSVGDTLNSTTDGTVLTITEVPSSGGIVRFSAQHQYLDDGVSPGNGATADVIGISAEVTDDDTLNNTSIGTTFVLINNVAPVVELNPITEIFENDFATLTGSITDPGMLDEQHLVIDWDDPNNTTNSVFDLPAVVTLLVGDTFVSSTDGSVISITGVDVTIGEVTFTVDHRYADDGPAPGNVTVSDVQSVSAIATDDDGSSSLSATRSVTVNNVQPEIGPVGVNATKGNKSAVNEDVVLTATFTDIGLLDRHFIEINWDDGSANSEFDVNATDSLSMGDTFTSPDGSVLTVTSVDVSTGEVAFDVSVHQYQAGGIFDVLITIRDDDSGAGSSVGSDVDSATTQAWISGLRLIDGVLYVIGTSDADHVTINKQGNGLLKVHADFLVAGNFETFPLADVQKIIAYLCEGDDHMTIAGNIDIPSIVHAGPDDDHINGGGGPTVLLGESGNDHLNGMNARDILIGGTGEDRLVGGKGDDVLIGGTTNIDDDDDALMDVLTAWASGDSYTNRVAAIDFALTVTDDEEDDRTTGSSDQDLFYLGLGDDLTDVSTNKNVETVL